MPKKDVENIETPVKKEKAVKKTATKSTTKTAKPKKEKAEFVVDLNFSEIDFKIIELFQVINIDKNNIIPLINQTITEKQKTEVNNFDIINTLFKSNQNNLDKKVIEILKMIDISGKEEKYSHKRKLSNEIKNDYIKKNFDNFCKKLNMSEGKWLDFSTYEYVINSLINNLNKKIRPDYMSRIGISKTSENLTWEAKEYATERRLLTKKKEATIKDDKYKDLRILEEDKYLKEIAESHSKIDVLRKTIISTLSLKKTEDYHFAEEFLTNDILEPILKKNFNGDVNKTLQMLNGDKPLSHIKELNEEIKNIYNFSNIVTDIMATVKEGKNIIFIVDNDNDGSSAYSGILEGLKKGLPKKYSELINVVYNEILPNSVAKHGINSAHVKKLLENGTINKDTLGLLVTADNGMSFSSAERDTIENLLPNSKIWITDHHLPTLLEYNIDKLKLEEAKVTKALTKTMELLKKDPSNKKLLENKEELIILLENAKKEIKNFSFKEDLEKVNSKLKKFDVNDTNPKRLLLLKEYNSIIKKLQDNTPTPIKQTIKVEDFIEINEDDYLNLTDKKNISKFNHTELTKENSYHKGLCSETARTKICCSKYNPQGRFKKEDYNISGAMVCNSIIKAVYKGLYEEDKNLFVSNYKETLDILDNISYFSNLADVVDTDIVFYPTKTHDLDKQKGMSTLMNLINNTSSFIGKDIPAVDFKELFGITLDEAQKLSNRILYINNVAKKYIDAYEKLFSDLETTFDLDKDQYTKVFNEIFTDYNIQEYQENYLSLLRPYFIALEVNRNKDIYQTQFLEKVYDVFKELKNIQNTISELIRNNPEQFIELSDANLKNKNSEILFIKRNPLVEKTKINRKLINIVLNDVNNGFRLILDGQKDNELSGSLRSEFPKQDIFEDEEGLAFQKSLNCKITMAGHDKAAGFTITFLDENPNKTEILSKLNTFIDMKIDKLREGQKREVKQTNIYDTSKSVLLAKINSMVFSSIPGKKEIPCNFFFNEYEIKLLEKEIEGKKYGWKKIDMEIMGTSLIVSIELLKKFIGLYKEGKKVSLDFSALSSDALIVRGIRDSENDKFIVEVNELDEYYKDYINTNFKNGVEYLSNEDLQKNIFFKYNVYGDIEFKRFQGVIISLLNETRKDFFNSDDVEATGLNMSEDVFNNGTLTYKIDPNSGDKLSMDNYLKRAFISHGREILLPEEDIKELIPVKEEDKVLYDERYLIYNEYEKGENTEKNIDGKWYYNSKEKIYPEIFSKSIDTTKKEVIINQKLIGENRIWFVKRENKPIPNRIEKLTNTTNKLIDEIGKDLTTVDNEMYEFFSSQKDKGIFVAHNLSYDYSIFRSNLNKTFNFLNENTLFYDSARANSEIRQNSLQMASIKLPIEVGDVSGEIKFKNYYGNNVSLEEFIEKIHTDKDFVELIDYKKAFVIKKKNNNIYFIDKEQDLEYKIVENYHLLTVEEIKNELNFKNFGVTQKAKYGVQSLLEEKYIKMLLHSLKPIEIEKVENVELNEYLSPFKKEFELFLSKYRFENTIEVNMQYFKNHVSMILRNELRTHHTSDEDKARIVKIPTEDLIFERLSPAFKATDYIDSRTKKPFEPQTAASMSRYKKFIMDNFESALQDNIKLFIENNKEVSALYTNRFHYIDIINHFPEDLSYLNENMIEKISSKTSYSVEMIKEIANLVIQFQEKNDGINIFAIHEVHNNIVANDTLKMGDVALEAPLSLVHILTEMYNPLNKLNMTDKVVAFIQGKMLETQTTIFRKTMKEELTVGQVNTQTYQTGLSNIKTLLESGVKENELSSFFQKILENEQSNTKMVKVKERLVPENSVLYMDVGKDYDLNVLKKDIEDIEAFLFIQNLKNSRQAFFDNISNIIDDNKNNFRSVFSHFFREDLANPEFVQKINKEIEKMKEMGEEDRAKYAFDNYGVKDYRKEVSPTLLALLDLDIYNNKKEYFQIIDNHIATMEAEILQLEEDARLDNYQSKEILDAITDTTQRISSYSSFQKNFESIKHKVESILDIDNFLSSIDNNLELNVEKLKAKYNLKLDTHIVNRKFKIIDEIMDFLQEYYEWQSPHFERIALSPKYTNRRRKTSEPVYIDPTDFEEFKNKFLTFIKERVMEHINLFNTAEQNEENIFVEIEKQFKFLEEAYFITKNTCETYDEKEDFVPEKYVYNKLEDLNKKFNDPLSEINNGLGYTASLSKYMKRAEKNLITKSVINKTKSKTKQP